MRVFLSCLLPVCAHLSRVLRRKQLAKLWIQPRGVQDIIDATQRSMLKSAASVADGLGSGEPRPRQPKVVNVPHAPTPARRCIWCIILPHIA